MVSRKKRVLSLLIAFVMLFSLWVIPNEKAYADTALPPVSSGNYISTYTYASSGKVYAYNEAALKTKTGGYISCATDECRIIEIKGQAVRVSYPVPGNRRTAWFSREAFTYRDLASNGAKQKFKCTKKVTTYKWKNKSNTFGYISSGDNCYLLRGDASSDWLQVIYPVSSGYKMGWVKGDDIRTVIWPVTTKITLNTSSVTLNGIGSTTTLRATVTPSNSSQSVSWSSSNNNVATVSGGTVKAVGAGTATITAKSGSKSASASVKVVAGSQPSTPTTVQPTGISLSSSSFTLTKKGETKKITATVSPSNATNKGVTWSSSNVSVATVSGGTVTAKANGKTTITAKTSNGISKSLTVTVKINLSNEEAVRDRLDKIAAGKYKLNSKTVLQVGKKFVGTKSNEQCKGYAKDVFYCCFKIWAGSTMKKPNNHKINNTSGMKLVATTSSVTEKSAKKLFSNARPGDFVQIRRSHTGSHSAILYKVTSTGVTFIEANLDGKNTIYKKTYTWKGLAKNAKMSVYTATSYKLK